MVLAFLWAAHLEYSSHSQLGQIMAMLKSYERIDRYLKKSLIALKQKLDRVEVPSNAIYMLKQGNAKSIQQSYKPKNPETFLPKHMIV
jgi:hypothetical protein